MKNDPRKLWRVLEVILAAAAAGVALAFLTHQVFDNYKIYDDEGLMLLSLDHYLRGGGLYTKTYTQYGPFYFYVQQFLHWLFRIPVNHDGGRILTLSYCFVSSLLGGVFIWRISRSILLGGAALLGVAVLSCKLGDEPGHPQEVVLILLILGVCFTLRAIRSPAVLFVLGGVGAAASLTKLNVGIFYMAALAHTLICLLKPSRLRSVGLGLTLIYAIVVPPVLMRDHLADWAWQYCILAILCGVAGFTQGAWIRTDTHLSARHLLYTAAGFGAVAAVILSATALQGVSAYALLDGIILSPSAHPRLFWIPWRTGWNSVVWAVLMAFVVIVVRFRSRLLGYSEWIDATRCLVGAAAILLLTSQPYRIKWTAPLLPLLILPAGGKPWRLSDLLPRLFVSDLALTQLLQPYPVGGSQLNVAAIPALLWAFVAVYDGHAGLVALGSRFFRFARPKLSPAVGLAVIAVTITIGLTAVGLERGYRFRSRFPSSGLTGSRLVRMRPAQAALYRWLGTTIHANCDTLFTMPGMGSLNFWSDVRPPNGSNLPSWVKAFSSSRQQEILDILKAHPRACVVHNPELNAFLLPGWTPAEETSLLATYILKNMRTIEQGDGYEIRVMPERTSPWIPVNRK